MSWLLRTGVPLLMAGMSARRYAALRGPMLWLALARGVGVKGAIPALVLLSLARRLTRRRRDARATVPRATRVESPMR